MVPIAKLPNQIRSSLNKRKTTNKTEVCLQRLGSLFILEKKMFRHLLITILLTIANNTVKHARKKNKLRK